MAKLCEELNADEKKLKRKDLLLKAADKMGSANQFKLAKLKK
jgi:hypothetical protein